MEMFVNQGHSLTPCHTIWSSYKLSDKKKTFEIILGKKENAGNQHFLLFTK